tara:strand:- start:65 stop:529 length:465 start_codon:yes stop_codon:yes gene_type:complete
MAKKEKKSKQNKLKAPAKFNLEDAKSCIIPDDAVINVPISGGFRKAIEDTLNFIMSPMTADEIVEVMQMIKVDFKEVPQEKITIVHKCVWTLLSLINEINHQAQDQGKTALTNVTVKQSVSDMMNDINDKTIAEVVKDTKQFSQEEFGEDISED